MLEMIIKNSGIITLVIVATAIVAVLVALATKKRRGLSRKGDLDRIWFDLNKGTSHDNILALFKEAMHIHVHYGVSLPSGCQDRWHLYSVAYAAINDRIDYLKREHDKTVAMPQFSGDVIRQRLESNLNYHTKELEKQLKELAQMSETWSPQSGQKEVEVTT